MENIKMLIVDDDIDFRSILKEYFEEKKYSVLEAESGVKALNTAIEEEPDIILLDVFLPGITGYEACRELKSDKRTKDISVIMLTARTGLNDKINGFLAGATKFISKPCAFEEIEESVNQALRIKKPFLPSKVNIDRSPMNEPVY